MVLVVLFCMTLNKLHFRSTNFFLSILIFHLFSMLFLCGVLQIILYSVVPAICQNTETSPTGSGGQDFAQHTEPRPETTTIINAPDSIEILQIYIPTGLGNAVKLIWGHNTDHKLNFTYGIHYGFEEVELEYPKNYTNDLSALVDNLEFCTKYLFAISANSESKINPNNIRSIVTEINRVAAPENLQVDFEPGQEPCLLIKWSASCANIGEPIGYIINLLDYTVNRTMNLTLPRTKRADYIYPLKVPYDRKFDIKVSTNFPEAQTTDTVTYKVPSFLQPYKVRVTSNPDGAFLIYWSEPYVPYYVGRYYYEVYIYKGPNLSSDYEKFYVTRPVIIHKGEESVYTFLIGLVSHNQHYRSLLTNPIVATSNGETTELSIGFS